MNIVIGRKRQPEATPYYHFASRKVSRAFSRFENLIEDISLFLSDENGLRGGEDKRCKIVIFTVHGGSIVVSDTQENWRDAISNAVTRARFTLARIVSKLKNQPHNSPLARLASGELHRRQMPASHRREREEGVIPAG